MRLVSGAAVLAIIVRAQPGGEAAPLRRAGSWASAAALFAYAAAFSFAYLRIGAGAGALILFGAVQVTMIGRGLAGGERPRTAEWLGLALALGGLAALTLAGNKGNPGDVGARAPDPAGAAMMAVAGIAWGVYSLRGRGVAQPLHATAGNFLRSVPFAAALALATMGARHATPQGLLLAVASGALASGVGYSLWYAALPGLSATRAAIVQLAVPVVTAAAAVALLDESVTPRVVIAALAILGGVAVALLGGRGTRTTGATRASSSSSSSS